MIVNLGPICPICRTSEAEYKKLGLEFVLLDGKKYCGGCIGYCDACNQEYLYKNMVECENCGDYICPKCKFENGCKICRRECYICNSIGTYSYCDGCDRPVCDDCSHVCDCGFTWCNDCSCPDCEE